MNRVLFLLVALLNATSIFSQSEVLKPPIQFESFKEVLQYADENAIAIKGAVINEQIANSGQKEAHAYLYPSINASAGYNNNLTIQPTLVPSEFFNPSAPSGSFEELTFGQQHLTSAGVQVQWDILNFKKIFASQTAKVVANQSEVNTQRSKFNTYNLLASTYYSIVLSQESIKIYEENIRISDSIYANTKEKFQKGILSDAELNAAEIKQLQNRRKLNLAEGNLSRFNNQLRSQLNTKEQIAITDTPQSFILENANLQTSHPEIAWQETEVRKYASLLKQKKSLLLPSLSFGHQYNVNWASDRFMDFSNSNYLPQQAIGAKLSIPLFNGFSSRQKIKQSKLELSYQQFKLENTKLLMQNEDEQLLLDLKNSLQDLSDNTEILKLMKENDIHSKNKYESGIISLNERLDMYEDLLTAQDNYLQSLASFTLTQYKVYIRQIDFNSNNLK